MIDHPGPEDDRQSGLDPGAPSSAATALCRDCAQTAGTRPAGGRCPACGSTRLVVHRELASLAIAHIDCDAFYAAVEKRDQPALADRPVIVGGGRRGVVSAACYIARLYGVRSAMPMFKALAACPDAVVIKPDMRKYADVGRQVRSLMQALTPLVEPLSIDEAFLDLSGTEELHGRLPAQSCALLAGRIERQIGVTASIGLSYNKFLAKLASDLDKPRGFAILGRDDASTFLADQPVSILWGVGKSLQARLIADGIQTVGQLRAADEATLVARYGRIGHRLFQFSRGRDDRSVHAGRPIKSISSETTFNDDLSEFNDLKHALWPLCERVAARLKRHNMAGRAVVLKLKTARFRQLTRSHTLADPTQLADVLYRTALPMLKAEANGTPYRLIGIGAADLTDGAAADPPDLFDPERRRRQRVEQAIDAVREKLGDDAILKGLGLPARRRPPG